MRKTAFDMVRNLNRRRKWLLTGLVLLVIYTIAGFFIFPAVARNVAADKLSQALGRNIFIETVRFNPFTLTLTVENFSLKQKDPVADMVFFRSLFLNLKWASLFRLAPVVSHVRLDTPVIHLSRDEQGAFNFSDLIRPKPDTPAPDKKADPSGDAPGAADKKPS